MFNDSELSYCQQFLTPGCSREPYIVRRGPVATVQPCLLVVIHHSERFAEVVVQDLLSSGVFALAHGPRFAPQLGFAPTPQGLDNVSYRRTCLWLT